MLEFRKANSTDIAVLSQMRVSMLCDGKGYTDEFKFNLFNNIKSYMTEGFEEKSFIIWVAAINNEIIAMGGITYYVLPPNDWCPDGKTAYIGNLYTIPDYRRTGIATKLLSLLVDSAKENHCERILLDATDMGKHIYEKYGFVNSDTAMAYYPFGIIPQ